MLLLNENDREAVYQMDTETGNLPTRVSYLYAGKVVNEFGTNGMTPKGLFSRCLR